MFGWGGALINLRRSVRLLLIAENRYFFLYISIFNQPQPGVQVRLFLGAIGGEVTAELPFVLMHPKPDMRRMIKVCK